MGEQEVVTAAVAASSEREGRLGAGMWQFPLASSHLAEVQMTKQGKTKPNKTKQKRPRCGCSQEVGKGIRSVSGKLAALFLNVRPR